MLTIIQIAVGISALISAWKIATKPNEYFFTCGDKRKQLTPEQEKQFDLMEYDCEQDKYIIRARG